MSADSRRKARRPHAVRRRMRVLGAAALTLAALLGARASADAAVLARWVEYGPEGAIEARAISDGAGCPAIAIDGKASAMTERAAPDAAFPVRVCAARLPAGASSAAVDGQALPLPAAAPKRILVLGDTGCRLKIVWFQACNDAAVWPFARNAASAARLKPDLVVHVGDYHYRESPCPPVGAGCAGSPWGDNWAAWRVDFFEPAAPLLAAAPWIVVRGNHEECGRAGLGWTRFLAPSSFDPAALCPKHVPPYAVAAGALTLVVLDTADAADGHADSKLVPLYRADFEAAGRLAQGPSWLVMHRPIWGIGSTDGVKFVGGNRTLAAALAGALPPAIELLVAGHIHALEILNYAGGAPPQLVVGEGGDDLERHLPDAFAGLDVLGVKVADGFSLPGFGFVLFENDAGGWSVGIYDDAGKLERRCRLGRRRIDCPGA